MTSVKAPTNLKCEYSVNPIGIDADAAAVVLADG